MEIPEQGARGVGDVGRGEGAAGELPDQPGVDGAEGEPAGGFTGAGDVLQDPGELGAGEVGVEHQAGALAEERLATLALQAVAEAGGAAVLPDDGVGDGLAGPAVP